MQDLDFVTFGVTPNSELLRRASEALSELYAIGDLELCSAWLYYGSLAAASKAFGVSVNTYRVALIQRPRHLLWRARRFSEMSEYELDIITDGSQMMMGMSRAERESLLPPNSRPLLTKERYIARIETWRSAQNEQWRAGYGFENPPVPSAVALVEAYVNCWRFRKHADRFFECRVMQRSLRRILKCKDRVEGAKGKLEICSIALEIIREYELYQEQLTAIRKHIEEQRRILKSRYKYFHKAVVKRDGLFCSRCYSIDNLELDHIKPVSLGGCSILENLQLLCHSCNIEKGVKEEDYRSDQRAI
jgi:5-methylcytosine-specific restriction endonuclease McrA